MLSAACLYWENRERGCWRGRPEAGRCAPCSWRCSQARGAPRMFLEGSKFDSFISARNPSRWVSALPVAYERDIGESQELSHFSEYTQLSHWAQPGVMSWNHWEDIRRCQIGFEMRLTSFSLVPVFTLLDDFLTICIIDQYSSLSHVEIYIVCLHT